MWKIGFLKVPMRIQSKTFTLILSQEYFKKHQSICEGGKYLCLMISNVENGLLKGTSENLHIV